MRAADFGAVYPVYRLAHVLAQVLYSEIRSNVRGTKRMNIQVSGSFPVEQLCSAPRYINIRHKCTAPACPTVISQEALKVSSSPVLM